MRTFTTDHRSNEGLHKLYVRYALETLEVLENTLEELEGQRRWQPSEVAHAIREKIASNVENDAAWFEAAALRYAHGDTSEFFRDGSEIEDKSWGVGS